MIIKPPTISFASAKGPSVTPEAVRTLPDGFNLLPMSRMLALNVSFHSLNAANISCISAGEGLFWLGAPRCMQRYFWVGIGFSFGYFRPSMRRLPKTRGEGRIGHSIKVFFAAPGVGSRATGSSSFRWLLPGPRRRGLLRWQPGDEVDAALEPFRESGIGLVACWVYVHHASQGPAGEVHGSRVRLSQSFLVAVQSDANHQRGTRETAAHAAVHHEAEPAEHLLLDDVPSRGED